MVKAFWKGNISFGLVSIPVMMAVATRPRHVSFHLLHEKCLTRPRQVLHCEKDNEYFGIQDTVRGYEYAKGKYIVVSEADLEKVRLKTAHAIEIVAFVESSEIDPLYYYDAHYLAPEEAGAKPFALLRETLLKTKRVGVAKVTFQREEHLCCLRPLDDIMLLETMHYEHEIVPREELEPPPQKLTAAEMEMAASLVGAMTRKFEPDAYRDEYQAALQKVIEARVKGEEVKVSPEIPEAEMADLMTALKASLDAAKKKTAAKAATK